MRITQFINAEPTFSEKDCRGFGWQFYILGIIKNEFTKKHGSAIAETIMSSMGLYDMDPIILCKVIGVIYQGRIFKDTFTKTALILLEAIRKCPDGKIAVVMDSEDMDNPIMKIESWDFGGLDGLKDYA